MKSVEDLSSFLTSLRVNYQTILFFFQGTVPLVLWHAKNQLTLISKLLTENILPLFCEPSPSFHLQSACGIPDKDLTFQKNPVFKEHVIIPEHPVAWMLLNAS